MLLKELKQQKKVFEIPHTVIADLLVLKISLGELIFKSNGLTWSNHGTAGPPIRNRRLDPEYVEICIGVKAQIAAQ